MNPYGYQQYKEQSVNTMTSGEMLLLLYDELIKRLTRAEMALQKQDYVLFNQSVDRSKDIINYLKSTLNREYAISAELDRMYNFFNYELCRISAGRNLSVLRELKPLVMELRDTFREAERVAR